jgi:spore coat polysaccharide biosynthesis protein SpsF
MILAIIQARMNSFRLPGKSMLPLAGKPVIEHVIERVKASLLVTHVVVATTDQPEDDSLAAHVESLGVPVYRGSQDDVLGRFYWASQRFPDCDTIVRITGDDPFKDPKLIDYALTAFLGEWADRNPELPEPHYMHLGGITWALGTDVEVFTRTALTEAFVDAKEPHEREHVTPYITKARGCWVIKDQQHRAPINVRHTIDTHDDYLFASWVYASLYESNPLFGYGDVLSLMKASV